MQRLSVLGFSILAGNDGSVIVFFENTTIPTIAATPAPSITERMGTIIMIKQKSKSKELQEPPSPRTTSPFATAIAPTTRTAAVVTPEKKTKEVHFVGINWDAELEKAQKGHELRKIQLQRHKERKKQREEKRRTIQEQQEETRKNNQEIRNFMESLLRVEKNGLFEQEETFDELTSSSSLATLYAKIVIVEFAKEKFIFPSTATTGRDDEGDDDNLVLDYSLILEKLLNTFDDWIGEEGVIRIALDFFMEMARREGFFSDDTTASVAKIKKIRKSNQEQEKRTETNIPVISDDGFPID
jgi:hypothetical protein